MNALFSKNVHKKGQKMSKICPHGLWMNPQKYVSANFSLSQQFLVTNRLLRTAEKFEKIYFSYHEEFLNWKLWALQPSYCHPPKNNKYDSVSSDSFQFFQNEHLPKSKNGISESLAYDSMIACLNYYKISLYGSF